MTRFKLTILQGLSKKEFPLTLGNYVIGRDPQAHIHLPSDFVSKQHAILHVTPAQTVIEDKGSRNGTFVNGLMIQKTVLHPGDKISFQNIVLEFQRNDLPLEPKPDEKISLPHSQSTQLSLFQRAFGPLFEQIAERVEWKYLTLLLTFLFVTLGFGVLVPPLLDETQVKLQTEALKRGEFIVKRIARDNQKYLSLKEGHLLADTLKLTTSLAQSEERLVVINIVDPKTKKVLAPPERLNQPIESKDAILRGTEVKQLTVQRLSTTQVLISEPVFVYSADEDRDIIAAVVQGIFNVEGIGLTPAEYQAILLRAFIVIFLIGLVFYFFLQQFTSAAFRKIYREIETATRKGYRHVELRTKFDEINHVIQSINKVFKRTRDLLVKLPEDKLEEEGTIENSDEILRKLVKSLLDGVVILNDAYHIIQINPRFEKMTGVRYDATTDQNLLDTLGDQELVRNITHGLGQAASGVPSEEEIYIGKDKYSLHIEAAKNLEDRISYYIVNLRQAD